MQETAVKQLVSFFEGRKWLPTDPHPCYWHPRAEIIKFEGVEPEEWVIELALEYGWQYNPHTKSFVKG
jgi:hypothetical protein